MSGHSISGISAGNYSYSLTDNAGCFLTGNIIVNSLSSLNIDTIISTEVSCPGMLDGTASANVSGNTGALTYLWSTGSSLSQVNNLAAGDYTLEVTDAAGCSDIKDFIVYQPAGLELVVNVIDAQCFGHSNGSASVSVTGGTAPYIYSWNGSQGSTLIQGLNSGNYSVQVNDANGCFVSEPFEVNEPDQLVVEIDAVNPTCELSNGLLNSSISGGTFPYTYLWNTGSASADLSGVSSGNYTLEVIDGNQCNASLTKVVTDPGNPVITNSIVNPLNCFNSDDGSIEVFASGGTGNLIFQWSDGTSESLAENLSEGSYSVIVSDAIGCETSETFNVTEPAILQLDLSVVDVLCYDGSNGQLNAAITGGTSPYVWVIEDENFQVQTNNTQLRAGVYVVRAHDNNNCSITDTAIINQPDLLEVSVLSTDALCYNSPSGFAEATVQGGVLPYSFLWSNSTSQAEADSLLAGNYSITISDANNCSASSTFQISEPNELIIQIIGPPAVCYNDEYSLSANVSGGSGVLTYEWTNGNENQDLFLIADTSMLWTVDVTDENQCSAQSSHAIIVNPLPPVEITPESLSLCAGDCIEVQALLVEGGNYIWKTGEQSLSGQSVSLCFDESGFADLNLTVIDINGCTNERLFENYFNIHELPVANFTVPESTLPLLNAVFHFSNQSVGAVDYLWDLNDRIVGEESSEYSLTYTYTEVGEYPVNLIAISEFGCTDEIQKWIKVTEDFAIFLPNAFTPNSDGLNDVFIPLGIGISSDNYRLTVFDRWGNEIFVSTEIQQGWDGRISNTGSTLNAESNVYVWHLQLETFDNKSHEYTGKVTLVR